MGSYSRYFFFEKGHEKYIRPSSSVRCVLYNRNSPTRQNSSLRSVMDPDCFSGELCNIKMIYCTSHLGEHAIDTEEKEEIFFSFLSFFRAKSFS